MRSLESNMYIDIDTSIINEIKDNNKRALIYIGRKTCLPCTILEPILQESLIKNNMKAYYYNTEKAKVSDYKGFQVVKKNFNIEHIPLVLYFNGQGNIERFDYYDFIESDNSISEFIENIVCK